MAAQLGIDLDIGVGQTMTNYVVSEQGLGDDVVNSFDVNDEDGTLTNRTILQTMDVISLTLIGKSGSTPASDFVKGAICAVAPLSNYYIDPVRVTRTEQAVRVEVTGTLIGIT